MLIHPHFLFINYLTTVSNIYWKHGGMSVDFVICTDAYTCQLSDLCFIKALLSSCYCKLESHLLTIYNLGFFLARQYLASR